MVRVILGEIDWIWVARILWDPISFLLLVPVFSSRIPYCNSIDTSCTTVIIRLKLSPHLLLFCLLLRHLHFGGLLPFPPLHAKAFLKFFQPKGNPNYWCQHSWFSISKWTIYCKNQISEFINPQNYQCVVKKKGADSWPNHWSIKNDHWQPNPLSFMTCTSYSAPSWVWLLDSPLDPQRWVDGRHGKADGKQATTGRSKATKTPFFLATFGHHFGERIKGRIGNISLWMNCHTGQGATGKGFCMDRDQAVLHCETSQGVAISEGLCFNSLNSPAQGRFRDMSEMPRQNASPTKVYKAVQFMFNPLTSVDYLFWLTFFCSPQPSPGHIDTFQREATCKGSFLNPEQSSWDIDSLQGFAASKGCHFNTSHRARNEDRS